MPKRFQRHDTLRLFTEIARHPNLSSAADALHMTKGAVSYQIKSLEDELRATLFHRHPRGISLTQKGEDLLAACSPHFKALEDCIAEITNTDDQTLTVGLSSYFAARWLSPRLTSFMQSHPNIRLRLQPMIQLFNLEEQGVDLAIRWGNGSWDDVHVDPIMPMPSWPVGNVDAFDMVQSVGLETAFTRFTLLRDHDDSNAWTHWTVKAGLGAHLQRDTLIIPDPNVRVQAVIDGQGIALMDGLVSRELQNGDILRLSDIELSDYGYFLVQPLRSSPNTLKTQFANWLRQDAPHQLKRDQSI